MTTLTRVLIAASFLTLAACESPDSAAVDRFFDEIRRSGVAPLSGDEQPPTFDCHLVWWSIVGLDFETSSETPPPDERHGVVRAVFDDKCSAEKKVPSSQLFAITLTRSGRAQAATESGGGRWAVTSLSRLPVRN